MMIAEPSASNSESGPSDNVTRVVVAFIVVEHPTADVAPAARGALARSIARACDGRGVATLILTNDEGFARAVAPRNVKLDGATGVLRPLKRGWFS